MHNIVSEETNRNIKMTFGIQQKHLDIIDAERKMYDELDIKTDLPKVDMVFSEHFWDSIGKKIGWMPFTIALHYFRHLRNIQSQSADLAETAPDIEKDEEIERLTEALGKIAKWELPNTGEFWDNNQRKPMSYEAAYGSNGAREYIRNIAKQALQSK